MKAPTNNVGSKRLQSRRCRSKGVTLVELVMVIVVSGILAGASAMFIKETVDLWSFLSFRSEVVAQERMALMRMAREIRQIKDKASISAAEAARFAFTDIHDVTFEYRVVNNSLMRRVGIEEDILINTIAGITFTYYDINNQVLANPALNPETNIRRIMVTLNIGTDWKSKTLTIQIYPRNLH